MPKIPPKLQTKILEDEFIDFTELLWVSFCFKYTSVGLQNTYKMVSENGSFVMKPNQKGREINGLMSWLHSWGLYEQVLLTANLYCYLGLAHYRDYIMQQDKKFILQAIYTYNI